MLLVILPLIPFLGALVLIGMGEKVINMPFVASSIVLILGSWGLRGAFAGMPITYEIPLSGPFNPTFQADAVTAVFVVLAAFLWWAVSIYAPEYMKHEGRIRSFYICTLLTQSAVLGVFVAGDLFTLLLFFELMTVASFFWVIHRWNEEAIRAAYFYLFFSIVGGLFIALGLVFIRAAIGGVPTIGTGPATFLDPKFFPWGLALFLAGFGIKAGMVPLHLWLPHAHSVAPTPASALLSGLLIKVGAYGLIRTGELAGWGMELASLTRWLGPGLTILGTCTMLVGVTAALLQSDAKRLLAYHSVSQMGYIILGLGVGLFLGPAGGMGLMGSIYHIVNHALFKAALFLGVGVVYVGTKKTNLYELGGLWRSYPVTAILMFLAVLGITGTPGLNGYASKTMLHHGVSEAASSGLPLMIWVERLFNLVGVGTTASFTKLFYLMFLGKPKQEKITQGERWQFQVAMGFLALVMVTIGVRPNLFVDACAIPAAQALGMEGAAATAMGLSFWNIGDIMGMVITLALGITFCWVGLKTGLFHLSPPVWLTLEGLGKMAFCQLQTALASIEKLYLTLSTSLLSDLRARGNGLLLAIHRLDTSGTLTAGGRSLADISLSAGVLIGTLIFLILAYTYIDLGSYVRLPLSLMR